VTWFETVGRLLGKPLREVTAAVDADQQTRAEIVRLSKSLHGLRQKYDPALRRIRNATIAHRETDAAAQLSIIDSIDPVEVVKLAAALLKWSTEFHQTLSRVTEAAFPVLAERAAQGAGE